MLLDTSIWIDFFRAKQAISETVKILLTDNEAWTCGIVLFEVLQGIKSESDRSNVIKMLSILPYVEMTPSLWRKSAEIAMSLKRKGLTIPNSDIFVSAIVMEHGLSLFTLDRHFKKVPGLNLFEAF